MLSTQLNPPDTPASFSHTYKNPFTFPPLTAPKNDSQTHKTSTITHIYNLILPLALTKVEDYSTITPPYSTSFSLSPILNAGRPL
jgi:hypothetical protein